MVWTDLVHAQPSDKPTGQAIEAILKAKARRTPAQRKLSSQLLDAAGVQPSDSVTRQRAPTADVEDEVVTVDIRADVTGAVLARIRALGGTVLSSVPEYRAIRARLPLTALGPLATLDAVQSIQLADRAITNQSVGTGNKVTEGDTAHQADDARDDHDVDGTGIGIGVISDGVRTLADRQASDDLPARVTVLPGQKGGPLSITGFLTGKGGDEGTAMLEIVHDLAPGAELYFAAGGRGEAQMAQNIKDLCAAGADIIVDDLFYFREPVFQDGIVAQAVNDVTADGCFYFSVAGNAGNLNDGTSGVWEGDYAEGTDFEVDSVLVGKAHDFGSGVEENQITKDGLAFVLQWADPLGASANDYDLFLVDADDNVLASSTTTQDGSQDPVEFIDSSGTDYTDNYLVVVKVSGAANRYLRLDTIRGQLEVATTGQTARHTAAENAVTVGAVDVRTAAGAGGVFNGTESVRTDSSDGPRRIFFQPDGTPITAGNFSATGGKLLQKPDLVAATCVSTTAPEFSPFCGSSSAAPHAAGIATLMLEAAGGPANVTLAELRTAMTGAALDIAATGVDINSGAGIVMAPGAVDAVDVAVADRNEAPTIEGTLTVDTLAPGADAVTLSVASAFTDPDTGDTLTYTTLSTDPDRVTASLSGSMLTLTPLAPGRAPVRVRAVDPDGLSVIRTVTVTVEAGTRDYDTDNDGFIEISNLTQFNAMRYDQDGDGAVDKVADWMSYYATSAFAEGALGMGCPGSCVGYELEADLDFDTNGSGDADAGDDYWDDGAGWFPFPVRFNIKGNGHTIANLFINRPMQAGSIGLFGNVWTPVAGHTVGVSGLRLIDVDVTGNVNVGGLSGTLSSSGFITGSSVTGRVQGTEKVGGLVGDNRGAISTSRASGHVSGTTSVGGLVGLNWGSITGSYATGEVTGETAIGGLVGLNWDSIETSYSTSKVTGQEQVGGLVGRNSVFSSITAGYATGRVSGTSRVGGLAGDNLESITASYATGPVSGETLVGGLTGFVNGSVTASYWDTTTSGEETSAGGSGVTTSALHAPTSATSIYQTWNTDHWDFGTTDQYPALKMNIDGQGTATWQEFGYQLRESPTLTARVRGTQVNLTWDPVDTSPWDPVPAVTYTIYRHTSTDIEMVAEDVSGPPYTTTGTTDTYQVVAVVGGGESVRSGLVLPDHPPTFPSTEDGTRSVAENTGANVNIGAPVTATDVNDDPLTYSLSGDDADDFSIDMSTGQLRTKAALDYETKNSYAVTVSVSDGPADPVTLAVTITVTDVNEPPAFPSTETGSRSVAENQAGAAVGAPVAATDPDTLTPVYSDLTYTLAGTDAGFFTIDDSGQLRTQAALDHEAKSSYQVTVSVHDGKDAAGNVDTTSDDTQRMTITVTNVNEPVVAGDDRFTLPEDTAPALAVLANDADPDGVVSLLPVIAIHPSHGTAVVSAGTGRIIYTPQEHFTGTDVFTYTVTDGTFPDTATVTLTITPVNDAPEFPATESGTRSVPENTGTGTAIGSPVQATDVDDPTLTYTLAGTGASAFTLDESTGQLRTKATLNYEDKKRYTVTVTAADDATPPATASRAVNITVTDVDEAGSLTLAPQPLVTAAFTATLDDPDQPLTALTWQWARAQTLGNWADIPRATAATYKPVADDEGYYLRVEVSYTDVHGEKGPLTAVSNRVEKKDSNEPPEFEEGATTTRSVEENTPPGQPIGAPVTATDPDDRASALRYALSGRDASFFAIDASGQLTVGAGTVLDYETKREYRVTVTVTDPFNTTDRITVTIAVSDVNEVPAFPAATAIRSIAEDTTAGQALGPPVTATDDDHDPLTYSLDPASELVFTIDERTGQMRTKAALDHETQPRYFVTIRVSDGKDDAGNPDLAIDATIDVTVTVTDAPGRVTLSSTRPLVGNALTATAADPDSPISVSTWRWERSEDGMTWGLLEGATTATYAPSADDSGHYLRVTATYADTDGNGTTKEVTSAQTQRVARRRGGGSGGSGGGGGGGGGGGAPDCAEDLHGNTAAQATAIALSTSIVGAICPAADVDYFTVTAPGRGLLFVDTIGGVPLRGTVWQDGVVTASGPTGRQTDDRLGARVEAGTVVVALQGQGGATGAYDVVVTFTPGYLENPGDLSFQSGVGVLSGWVCEAAVVEIELNGVPQEAAYGTERLDTAGVCGDTDNGFGLLFNWNRLGDGEHTVVALVDGVELGQATVTVTTLGQEFLKEVAGTCEVEDFPTRGERVTLVWQQTSQNFVLAGGSPPAGSDTGRTSALTGFLENPGHNSFQSGVRVVSGWVCDANTVELAIGDLGRQEAAYGTERLDTLQACGDTDNGFGLLFNWNRLGDGEHAVVAYVDGVELGWATVQVTTLGEEFLREAEGECVVEDFPMLDERVLLEWQQNSQNFVITDVE